MDNYLERAQRRFNRANALAILDEELPRDLRGPSRPHPAQVEQWRQAIACFQLWNAGSLDARGVQLVGAVGRGKSRLMATLLYMAADRWGRPALYINAAAIDAELRATYSQRPDENARSEHALLELALERDVIAVDDAGASKGEHVARLTRALIDLAAANGKFLILTSNQTDADLAANLGGDQREQSRRAALERIVFLPSSIPDYRRA